MSRLTLKERTHINAQDWVYCTKCWTHWLKPGWPMSVTNFHLGCEGNIEVCYAPLRCNQWRRQHNMEPYRGRK